MPYLTCTHCALTAYSAARWTTTDDCPGCGTLLAQARGYPASSRGTAPVVGTTDPASTGSVPEFHRTA